MFYLALKRDLGKISLARKHVLSENELFGGFTTIDSIASAALERIESLRCKFEGLDSRPRADSFHRCFQTTEPRS